MAMGGGLDGFFSSIRRLCQGGGEDGGGEAKGVLIALSCKGGDAPMDSTKVAGKKKPSAMALLFYGISLFRPRGH